MRNRALALMLGAGLMLFGVAACGDDDDGGGSGDTETETTEGGDDSGDDSGDDGGESGNAEVEEYCDAAAAFAAEVEEAGGDPAALGNLSTEAQELGAQAADLATAGLSAEDGERVTECTEVVTDAAAGLAGN